MPAAHHTLFTIACGSLALGVDPGRGRVVKLSPAGSGTNLLWENPAPAASAPWPNWGGDKVWPASQTIWPAAYGHRWPPDPVIDGQPWRVTHHQAGAFTFESGVSPQLGVRAVRHVLLHAGAMHASWINRLHQVQRGTHPVQVWTVTQVSPPRQAWLDRLGDDWTVVTSGEGTAPVPVFDEQLQAWSVPLDRPVRWKVGTMGRWLALAWERWILVQVLSGDAAEPAAYPEHSRLQLFACPEYAEMETLSPSRRLETDETLESRVEWIVLPIPQNESATTVLHSWLSAPKPSATQPHP